jgi:hypothetical protein
MNYSEKVKLKDDDGADKTQQFYIAAYAALSTVVGACVNENI